MPDSRRHCGRQPRRGCEVRGRWRVACLSLMLASAAPAATFTVTTTADAGHGSLRQAILDANAQQSAQCTAQRIAFAIPGAGPHTIRPLSALPAIQIPTDVDGYSQPGASPNSLFNGNNAVLLVEIDGSLAGPVDGLVVGIGGVGVCGGTGSLIRGLVINRFAGSAIAVGVATCPAPPCTVGAVRIQGNRIGTDVAGTVALGNGSLGVPAIRIGVQSSSNVIGDQTTDSGGSSTPAAALRNLISGNAAAGIGFVATGPSALSAQNNIRNNYIGLDASGTALVPNGGPGIRAADNVSDLRVQENLIGGNVGDGIAIDGSGARAVLSRNGIGVGVGGVAAGNGGDGVRVAGGAIVSVVGAYPGLFPPLASLGNNAGAGVYVEGPSYADVLAAQLAANAGLGIDLAPRGVDASDPLDVDTGPNDKLNAPIIDSVETDAATQSTTYRGRLQTEPNASIEVTFYANPRCDPDGTGEGLRRLTTNSGGVLLPTQVTDASGLASFEFTTTPVQAQPVPRGQAVTAVARRFAPSQIAVLAVSEFSNCRVVRAPGEVFTDGFEP